ncbi:MAG: tagaturonate epimerase family protein, partial [Planctomycetota bacterium]
PVWEKVLKASRTKPENLKLSVHSGSDKYSIYPIIRQAILETGAGLHIKTAGTTWLEELIGLAESGDEGTLLVREIYSIALEQIGALTEPYASVIDIHMSELPSLDDVASWDGTRWANTLRHIPSHPQFNPHVRQLLHVAFKLAAKKGTRYTDLLKSHSEIIGNNVFENLYTRHMKPLFLG